MRSFPPHASPDDALRSPPAGPLDVPGPGETVDLLVSIHSFWRWIVLVAAVVALAGAFVGWFGSLPPSLTLRRLGTLYVGALDLQIVIGIVIWIGEQRWLLPGFHRAEHPATMLLAAVVAHVGQVLARRSTSPTGAARTLAIALLVSLVLVVIGIPGVVRGG